MSPPGPSFYNHPLFRPSQIIFPLSNRLKPIFAHFISVSDFTSNTSRSNLSIRKDCGRLLVHYSIKAIFGYAPDAKLITIELTTASLNDISLVFNTGGESSSS
ncbi:hypothetical protein TWF706_007271 [Orbilia oligospora]|nr:hypothetical protein TWF706_007271 [Orbilia oligospora]